jgi:hypothetical protein
MHLTKRKRRLFPRLLVATVVSSLGAACGVAIKRDLSAVPPGTVGFDDMCGLQEYFDSLEGGVAREPAVASSLELEGGDGQKSVRGGKVRLVYEGDFLLKHARRVLDENWRRLPPSLATTDKIELEVRWAERAGVKRVVTDQDAELFVDGRDYALPYHPCLTELMFGAPIYKQRQVMWGLPNPALSKPLDLALDAGEPEASTVIEDTPDAGPPTVRPAPPAM